MINKQQILIQRPVGLPEASTWEFKAQEVRDLKAGEMLIEQHYISLDPAMRGWMNETRSYIPPVALGEVMRAGSIGKVIATSGETRFNEGDFVSGWGGVQQYVITTGEGYLKVNPSKAPLSSFIGTLGMPGMTAYFGILEVAQLKADDVVLISGAAGAVGSVAGQIAKIKGCTVIGIAGGPDKCQYLIDELGFDGAVDYKNESVSRGIRKLCPKGVDVYFDNVGGTILDSALANIRLHARIVICGAISQYNSTQVSGPKNYLSLLVNRASMKGMVVLDYVKRYKEAAQQMTEWIESGELKSKEDVYEGIENFYETFLKLFSGEKLGKLVLKVKED